MFLKRFGAFLKRFGAFLRRFWAFWGIFGCFWSFWGILGHFGGVFWSVLGRFGEFWGVLGRFWGVLEHPRGSSCSPRCVPAVTQCWPCTGATSQRVVATRVPSLLTPPLLAGHHERVRRDPFLSRSLFAPPKPPNKPDSAHSRGSLSPAGQTQPGFGGDFTEFGQMWNEQNGKGQTFPPVEKSPEVFPSLNSGCP